MWMVVSEDPASGRIRYHEVKRAHAAVGKRDPEFLLPIHYARARNAYAASFPDPAFVASLPPPLPHPHFSGSEVEQYDNVDPPIIYGYGAPPRSGYRRPAPPVPQAPYAPPSSSSPSTSSSDYQEGYQDSGYNEGSYRGGDDLPVCPTPDYSPPPVAAHRVRFDLPISKGEVVRSVSPPPPRTESLYASRRITTPTVAAAGASTGGDPKFDREGVIVSTSNGGGEGGEPKEPGVVSVRVDHAFRHESPPCSITADKTSRRVEEVYSFAEMKATASPKSSIGSSLDLEFEKDEEAAKQSRQAPPPLPPQPPSKQRIMRLENAKKEVGRASPVARPKTAPSRPAPPAAPAVSQPKSIRAPTAPFGGFGGGGGGYPTSGFSHQQAGISSSGAMIHVDTRSVPMMKKEDKKDKKNKKEKKKITKADISNPTNFQHKAHVGWSESNGFEQNMLTEDISPEVREILKAAGQDPQGMTKKDIKFVYDFIQNYPKDSDAPPIATSVNQWSTPSQAPPPPTRGASTNAPPVQPVYGATPVRPPPRPATGPQLASNTSRNAARPLPQPPSHTDRRVGVPPPPPPPPTSYGHSPAPPPPPPPPPPPMGGMSGGAPPPPPPPPPPPGPGVSLPSAQNGRGDLLAEIQRGKQLRSVNAASSSPSKSTSSGDSRDDLLAGIRAGATLKHIDVEEKRKSNSQQPELTGIAGALAKALAQRRNDIGTDDSDEDSDTNEDDWND